MPHRFGSLLSKQLGNLCRIEEGGEEADEESFIFIAIKLKEIFQLNGKFFILIMLVVRKL